MSEWALPIPYREDGETYSDFHETANLGNNQNEIKDFVVPAGKLLLLKQLFASSSINFRIQLQIEVGVAFVTKYVDFQEGGKQGLNPQFADVEGGGVKIEAGKRVRITATGRNALGAGSVYFSIMGVLQDV